MKLLYLIGTLLSVSVLAQVAAPESGIYALQDVKGTSTVWASHVPGDDLEAKNIKPYLSKITEERSTMPAYPKPKLLTDGVGHIQKNFLIFRRTTDGQYEGVLKYGDNMVPVIVVNSSYSTTFIEASEDAQTIYTVHRNVKNADGTYLVTVSATKNTAMYVCTWSFAGKATLEKK